MHAPLLTVPNQTENTKVELSEKAIQKWIDDLPLLNLVESVPALLNNIQPLNAANIADKQRIKLLELYKEPVNKIVNGFDQSKLKQLPVSDERRQELIEEVTNLVLELANGYKIVVKNSFQNKKNPAKDSQLLLAMHRAMEHICKAIINCYRLYKFPPPFAFLEINQLYRFAEYHKAIDLTIGKSGTTTGAMYKRMLLLTIADPFQLAEGEVVAIFRYLSSYIKMCTLTDQPPVAGEELGLFTVDLDGDSAPMPMSRSQDINDSTRVFDVRPVLASLLKQVKVNQKDQKVSGYSLEQKILSRLVPNLTAVTERRDDRETDKSITHIAIGVPTAHHFLEAGHNYADGQVVNIQEAASQINIEKWEILDKSKNGFKLQQTDESTENIAVGELVAINSDKRFNIYITRWVKRNQANKMEVGLEKITGTPVPAICSVTKEGGDYTVIPVIYMATIQGAMTGRFYVQKYQVEPDMVVAFETVDMSANIKIGGRNYESAKVDEYTFSVSD